MANHAASFTWVKSTMPRKIAAIYPTIIPINIEETLKKLPWNCFNTTMTTITRNPTSKCFQWPNPSEFVSPPPRYLIPTGSSDKPMDNTTRLVTTGANIFRNGLIKKPSTISINAPIMDAPRIAPYPLASPITFAVPMNPELVPITTGSPEPIFQIG